MQKRLARPLFASLVSILAGCGPQQESQVSENKQSLADIVVPINWDSTDPFYDGLQFSVVRAFELFPAFSPVESSKAPLLTIKKIVLPTQPSQVGEEKWGTVDKNLEQCKPVELKVGEKADVKVQICYQVNYSKFDFSIKGVFGDNNIFTLPLSTSSLIRFDKVIFNFAGQVTADLFTFLPGGMQQLVTKSFGNMFSFSGGIGRSLTLQDYVAVGLMPNSDRPDEIAPIVIEIADVIKAECQRTWIKKYPKYFKGVKSCDYNAPKTTRLAAAFADKVDQLNNNFPDQAMAVTNCEEVGGKNSGHFLLYASLPGYSLNDSPKTIYLNRLVSKVRKPLFGSIGGSFPNIKAYPVSADQVDESLCHNKDGDSCLVYSYKLQGILAGGFAQEFRKTCSEVKACGAKGGLGVAPSTKEYLEKTTNGPCIASSKGTGSGGGTGGFGG